jgi:hypothetical protein
LATSVSIASSPPGAGWTPVLTAGGKTLVAVKEGDVRQVWVGFESRPFARTPAFVIFWTSIFDWLGGGAEGFTSAPLSRVEAGVKRLEPRQLPADTDSELWPGIFQDEGQRLAMNAGEVTFARQPTDDWKQALSRLLIAPKKGIDLAPWLAFISIICLAGAAARWEQARRTRAVEV